MTKTLQDAIVRISNGYLHKLIEIEVINSFLIVSFLKLLYSNGFIRGFIVKKNTILVLLKYYRGVPAIRHISTISKLSRRVYLSKREIITLSQNQEFFVLTTPKGLFTNKNILDENFMGGEILCRVS